MELQFHFFFKLQTEYLYLIMTSFVALHVAHPIGVGQVMGSILDAKHIIAKDVKTCTYSCYVRSGTCQVNDSMCRGNALATKKCISAPCTVRNSRQRLGCSVLCSMARISIKLKYHNTPYIYMQIHQSYSIFLNVCLSILPSVLQKIS